MDSYPIKKPVPKYQVKTDYAQYYPDYWVEKSVRILGIHLYWKKMAYYANRQRAKDIVKSLELNPKAKL